jgi:hypothetical protein
MNANKMHQQQQQQQPGVNNNKNIQSTHNNNSQHMWHDESNSGWTGTGVMSDRSSDYSIDDGVIIFNRN